MLLLSLRLSLVTDVLEIYSDLCRLVLVVSVHYMTKMAWIRWMACKNIVNPVNGGPKFNYHV